MWSDISLWFDVHFPDISDVEHLSTYPLAIWIPSLEKCLLRSYDNLNGLFLFWLLSCMNFLYTLGINPISNRWFVNIFFCLIDCLFILSIISLALQKLFSWMQSHLLIFVFLVRTLGTISPKSLLRPVSRRFPLSFLPGVLRFQVLTFVLSLFGVDFRGQCQTGAQLPSFAREYLASSAPFSEELSTEYSWLSCQILVDCICVGILNPQLKSPLMLHWLRNFKLQRRSLKATWDFFLYKLSNAIFCFLIFFFSLRIYTFTWLYLFTGVFEILFAK